MAERKATNKYYPPDWDPSKGSANKYQGSHHLRSRAKKISEGVLVVRFAMPFDIWCMECKNHIAMGVRYNAEKSKVGNYYTTPIYRFQMKCRLCDNHFVIKTDPSKFDYVIVSGARKKIKPTPESNELIIDEDDSNRRISDAMYRLERRIEDKTKAEAELPGLRELKKWRSRWEDSFSMNKLIRSQFRERRKLIEQSKDRDKKLLTKASLKIKLVEPTDSIRKEAKQIYKTGVRRKAEMNPAQISDITFKNPTQISKTTSTASIRIKSEKNGSSDVR